MAIPFDPKEIVRTLGVDLRKARELIGLAFVRDVVPSTPVRTGHARRNWQVNWGAPTGQELPGVDAAGGNTVINGEGRIKTGRRRNPFLPLVIENNVPYIGRLNEGSSKQAPPMFVERSIQLAINALPRRKFL
jgi:hypothetical protein